MASFSFYNVGANYILVAIAVGGFFHHSFKIIPFSGLYLLVPLTSLVLLFMTKLLEHLFNCHFSHFLFQ